MDADRAAGCSGRLRLPGGSAPADAARAARSSAVLLLLRAGAVHRPQGQRRQRLDRTVGPLHVQPRRGRQARPRAVGRRPAGAQESCSTTGCTCWCRCCRCSSACRWPGHRRAATWARRRGACAWSLCGAALGGGCGLAHLGWPARARYGGDRRAGHCSRPYRWPPGSPSFLDPLRRPHRHGFQAVHGMYALASGGCSGVGLGASREKWGCCPTRTPTSSSRSSARSSASSAAWSWSALFGVLAYAGFRIAQRTTDPFIRLAASPSPCGWSARRCINMGSVVGLLPITGHPAAADLLRRLVAGAHAVRRRAAGALRPHRAGAAEALARRTGPAARSLLPRPGTAVEPSAVRTAPAGSALARQRSGRGTRPVAGGSP